MKPILVLLLSGLLFHPICGQVAESQRFSRVPEQHRAKLKEGLENYIEYYRIHNWEGVYNWLYDPKQTKEEFVNAERNYDIWGLHSLVSFTPMVVGTLVDKLGLEDAGYSLTGCVRFKKGKSYRYNLSAYLLKGEWRFSEILPAYLLEGIPNRPCNPKDYEPPPR